MLDAAAAIVLNGAGVAAIFLAWRGVPGRGRLLGHGGWIAVAAGAVFWCRLAGIEFGIAYAVLFTIPAAWAAVVVNHELRTRRGVEQGAGQTVVPDSATLARHAARFVVAVPLAALASIFAGVVLTSRLPMGRIEAMAIAVLGIPVLWGILSYWACADQRSARPALCLTVVGAASAALVYLG